MPTLYWRRGAPPGPMQGQCIGIAEDNSGRFPNFQAQVAAALDTLDQLPSGNALLTAILAGVPRVRVGIQPSRMFNNGFGLNECASLATDPARTDLASAIGGGAKNGVINSLKLAMNRAGHQNDFNWLATQINATPRYRIRGVPATSASNLGVLPLDIQRWLDFNEPRPLFYPFRGQDLTDLTNIILTVIDGALPAPGGAHLHGGGGSSRVYWDPTKDFNNLTTGAHANRPAYIGLGHELIHAYYNGQGRQLSQSEDSDHPSTVLFEYMAVGLGPWRNEPISENALRRDAGIMQRQTY